MPGPADYSPRYYAVQHRSGDGASMKFRHTPRADPSDATPGPADYSSRGCKHGRNCCGHCGLGGIAIPRAGLGVSLRPVSSTPGPGQYDQE